MTKNSRRGKRCEGETIGIDLGDKLSRYAVVSAEGEVVEESSLLHLGEIRCSQNRSRVSANLAVLGYCRGADVPGLRWWYGACSSRPGVLRARETIRSGVRRLACCRPCFSLAVCDEVVVLVSAPSDRALAFCRLSGSSLDGRKRIRTAFLVSCGRFVGHPKAIHFDGLSPCRTLADSAPAQK
jgi:hypothetical protein